MNIKLSISGTGMINPVGVGTAACLAASRAGINMYHDSPIIRTNGVPYKMALVPEACLPELALHENNNGKMKSFYLRMLKLGASALSQAFEAAKIDGSTPIFLAVPEQRCGRPYPALEPVLKDLYQMTGLPIDLVSSRIFPMGRSAGFYALEAAKELLENSSLEQIVVGGIDTYLDLMLLSALDQEGRLSGGNSTDYFVPGEGAAFIVLKKTDSSNIMLGSVGLGEEAGHLYSDEVCLGKGLSGCLSEALNGWDQHVKTVFCSMNGESFNGKEWGAAIVRNSEQISDEFQSEHPAECYGDIGAATVPTLLGLAHDGLLKGNYKGPILIWGASDREHRGAVTIALIGE